MTTTTTNRQGRSDDFNDTVNHSADSYTATHVVDLTAASTTTGSNTSATADVANSVPGTYSIPCTINTTTGSQNNNNMNTTAVIDISGNSNISSNSGNFYYNTSNSSSNSSIQLLPNAITDNNNTTAIPSISSTFTTTTAATIKHTNRSSNSNNNDIYHPSNQQQQQYSHSNNVDYYYTTTALQSPSTIAAPGQQPQVYYQYDSYYNNTSYYNYNYNNTYYNIDVPTSSSSNYTQQDEKQQYQSDTLTTTLYNNNSINTINYGRATSSGMSTTSTSASTTTDGSNGLVKPIPLYASDVVVVLNINTRHRTIVDIVYERRNKVSGGAMYPCPTIGTSLPTITEQQDQPQTENVVNGTITSNNGTCTDPSSIATTTYDYKANLQVHEEEAEDNDNEDNELEIQKILQQKTFIHDNSKMVSTSHHHESNMALHQSLVLEPSLHNNVSTVDCCSSHSAPARLVSNGNNNNNNNHYQNSLQQRTDDEENFDQPEQQLHQDTDTDDKMALIEDVSMSTVQRYQDQQQEDYQRQQPHPILNVASSVDESVTTSSLTFKTMEQQQHQYQHNANNHYQQLYYPNQLHAQVYAGQDQHQELSLSRPVNTSPSVPVLPNLVRPKPVRIVDWVLQTSTPTLNRPSAPSVVVPSTSSGSPLSPVESMENANHGIISTHATVTTNSKYLQQIQEDTMMERQAEDDDSRGNHNNNLMTINQSTKDNDTCMNGNSSSSNSSSNSGNSSSNDSTSNKNKGTSRASRSSSNNGGSGITSTDADYDDGEHPSELVLLLNSTTNYNDIDMYRCSHNTQLPYDDDDNDNDVPSKSSITSTNDDALDKIIDDDINDNKSIGNFSTDFNMSNNNNVIHSSSSNSVNSSDHGSILSSIYIPSLSIEQNDHQQEQQRPRQIIVHLQQQEPIHNDSANCSSSNNGNIHCDTNTMDNDYSHHPNTTTTIEATYDDDGYDSDYTNDGKTMRFYYHGQQKSAMSTTTSNNDNGNEQQNHQRFDRTRTIISPMELSSPTINSFMSINNDDQESAYSM
jgi:hypothetical protein